MCHTTVTSIVQDEFGFLPPTYWTHHMSHHDHDPIFNTSDNAHFQDVLSQSLQNPARRGLLRGGLGLAGLGAYNQFNR
jgi:hypothetical protein